MARTAKASPVTKAVKTKKKDESGFVPNYSDIIDDVEKSFRLNASSMNKKGVHRVSTGLLQSDFVMGGGIPPGAWITLYGMEQSAKSTHMMQMLKGAVEAKLPNTLYFDYEGCVTKDCVIQINGTDKPVSDLIPQSIKDNLPNSPGFVEGLTVEVDTLGSAVEAQVYFGGVKPITEIKTTCGHSLKGSNHPIMVLTTDGCLFWKKIEDIQLGDKVIVRKTQ